MAGNWNSGRRPQATALKMLRGNPGKRRLAPEPAPSKTEWAPPDGQLAALQAAGRAFVARLVANYVVDPLDGELVIELAVAQDRLAEIRATRGDCSATDRRALNRSELAWQKAYTTSLLALRARVRQDAPSRTGPPAGKWGVQL